MARAICIRFGEDEQAFDFRKIDREKLYGKKERVVVDEQGEPCRTAFLTEDGAALVPTGGTAHLWVDEGWNASQLEERRVVDETGKPRELRPSTLGTVEQAQVVSPQHVLDHLISAVYVLEAEQLAPAIGAALARGDVLEVPFRFRDAYEDDALFIVGNSEGVFGLVGCHAGFSMISRDQPLEPLPSGPSELDDDLDFSMI